MPPCKDRTFYRYPHRSAGADVGAAAEIAGSSRLSPLGDCIARPLCRVPRKRARSHSTPGDS